MPEQLTAAFVCDLSFKLIASDSWAVLERTLALPFVPFPGLGLTLGDGQHTVLRVSWHDACQVFEVELNPWDTPTLLADVLPGWLAEAWFVLIKDGGSS